MVSHKTRKRATVKIIVVLVFLLALSTSFAICAVFRFLDYRAADDTSESITPIPDADELPTEPVEPDMPEIVEVDFQPVVDKWVKSISGSKGVLIYDLDLKKTVGAYEPDQKFSTASLYKLFVVYEGYRRLENGTWQNNDSVGRTGYTVLKCLDLAIRESNSVCAETLWGMIGRDTLDEVSGISVGSLKATPTEIMQIMRKFYEHADITDENLLAIMKDSFLNQPVTTYNWRQGLPSGFSDAVKVYNKVGWNYDSDRKVWTIYDDAAIVKFSNGEDETPRNFIVVVMTSGINFTQIRRLGTEIESAYNDALTEGLVSTEEL